MPLLQRRKLPGWHNACPLAFITWSRRGDAFFFTQKLSVLPHLWRSFCLRDSEEQTANDCGCGSMPPLSALFEGEVSYAAEACRNYWSGGSGSKWLWEGRILACMSAGAFGSAPYHSLFCQ